MSQNLIFAREILEHGKHVWFDKPAGDNLDTFREVLDIARDRNLLVQLGYMFRYNAGFQFILNWANSGKLGDIQGEKSPDRSLDHEFTVQETVLQAAGLQ